MSSARKDISTAPGSADLHFESVAIPGRVGVFRLRVTGECIADLESMPGAGSQWVALPGLSNLHAHADRSFTVQTSRPKSLQDALSSAATARATFTPVDVASRAEHFFRTSILHGVTKVRTHTDVDAIVDMRSLEGVSAARDSVSGLIDVDVIAFSNSRNDLSDPNSLARLRDALHYRPEFIGASLNSSADPERATKALMDLMERTGIPADLHIDEHLDPTCMLCTVVAQEALARGLIGKLTFSHACVLSMLDRESLHSAIDLMARAGVTVIALPETNLFLQGRRTGSPLLRGTTAVHELMSAGIPVRLGTDNVRDWFYPFGTGDLLDTALTAAVALHLDSDSELVAALCDGRTELSEGDIADLVLIPASSLDDALARRPSERVVLKAGRIVSGPVPADSH